MWLVGLKIKRHKQRLASTQRKVVLRVASAYRTTSTGAVLVIAGMIPLDLLAEGRERIYFEDEEGGISNEREKRSWRNGRGNGIARIKRYKEIDYKNVQMRGLFYSTISYGAWNF